ncbi:hypothetical protein JOE50_004275 [Bradyrhizobium japonicum]|nr:hypothetical protein [Bradyrhizobium japonicum]
MPYSSKSPEMSVEIKPLSGSFVNDFEQGNLDLLISLEEMLRIVIPAH